MRLQPSAFLRSLTNKHGEIEGPRGRSLAVARLGRMLKGIVQNSALIAVRDNVPVVGESQLMRAYIERVSQVGVECPGAPRHQRATARGLSAEIPRGHVHVGA